jgi:hypothetical protein
MQQHPECCQIEKILHRGTSSVLQTKQKNITHSVSSSTHYLDYKIEIYFQ